jgi:hypothetical protein
MQCDMFFIDWLVAMDPIMQFLSSTSVDSSDPLWEDRHYVISLYCLVAFVWVLQMWPTEGKFHLQDNIPLYNYDH